MTQSPLDRDFGKLHALHVAALTRHLVACRAAFDGDLDLFLVLTIIGERSFAVRNAPAGMTLAEFNASPVSLVEPVAINLQSIADFSGIPRETVRRKVGALVARGWVRRDGDGLLAVTDFAKDSLQPLTENPLHRYAIGDRTRGLRHGRDGSLDIILASTPPAEGTSNWLPVPPGPFHVVTRLYLPGPEALDGRYALPPIQPAD